MPVDHYENFPVASLLLPARLREPIEAIYAFARSADDIADEGDAAPVERLAHLNDYRRALDRIEQGDAPHDADVRPAGRATFARTPCRCSRSAICSMPSARTSARRATRISTTCSTTAGARPIRSGACCCTSIAPTRPPISRQSDAICTSLQLINFWQDVAHRLARTTASTCRRRNGALRGERSPTRRTAGATIAGVH